jgi:hypothetical protein
VCVLISSKPLAAVVSRRVFLIAIIVMAALQLYRAAMAIRAWPVTGSFAATALRLTISSTDGLSTNGSLLLTAATRTGITAVGLLQDGCLLPPVGLTAVADRSSVAVFNDSMVCNGYYFLGAANRSAGPMRWTLEAATDPNGTGGWTPVGASAWRINPQARSAFRAKRCGMRACFC